MPMASRWARRNASDLCQASNVALLCNTVCEEIERVVRVLGSLEQMELDEPGDLGQLGVAAQPHLLEGLFGAFLHAESVHRNEHRPSPGPGQNVAVIGGVPATQVIASRLATARRARVRDNIVATREDGAEGAMENA